MYDVVVIGAGPAGLSAATASAELGLKTLVLDEQSHAGGQIYRNVASAPEPLRRLLGRDYSAGHALLHAFEASGAQAEMNAFVWDVSRELEVAMLQGERTFLIRAKQLIAATGAIERPSPLPGWTLPGLMNAGAVQIAMKSGRSIPAGRIALVGCGPLLLLLACQLLDAGADLAAIVDTADSSNRWRAARRLPAAIRAPEYLAKGLGLLAKIARSRVARFRAAKDVRIVGKNLVTGLRFACAGREETIAADLVLVHHGVLPNQQLARLLRVDHAWDPQRLAWRTVCDAHGGTSLPGFRLAGDCVAIDGARAAEASGALAALGAARDLGRITDAECSARSAALLRAVRRHQAIRPFLDTLYRPPSFITHPPDDVIVCRCEEVSAGTIREMAALGCQGPNQTKFFSRCGMGPCQGRICGIVVTQLLAEALRKPEEDVGAYRVRAPLKPLPLSALASLSPLSRPTP